MKKKLIVWIFQTGEPLQIDDENPRPMRAMNLSNFLVNSGHKVVLWSSDFYHQKKVHRFNSNKRIKFSDNLEIRLLHSRGYEKNISFARIIDHLHLAYCLNQELKLVKEVPDVAFIGYPPIESAAILTRWLHKRSIPILLDIKDQWPTLFIDAFPKFTKGIGKVIFWPYYFLARKAISESTGISSMSNGFIEWVKNFSGEDVSKSYKVFPLTSQKNIASNLELSTAKNWLDDLGINNNQIANICFIGSLSQAFDFEPIKKAALISNSRDKNIRFIICGDGNEAEKIKALFDNVPNVIFPGWVNRTQIEVLANHCIGFIAPYKNTDNFIANLPNKIIDSMALRLPIITPLRGEVRKLIIDNNIGLIYDENSGEELFNMISKLKSDDNLKEILSKNAYDLYLKNFSYEFVYNDLVEHLEKMANSSLSDD